MAKLVHNYTSNGSSTTDEYGTFLVLNRLITGDVVEGFAVVANGTPNMTVRVNPGSGRISTGTYPASYGYLISHDTSAGEVVTISTAAASPRKDWIVAYVDKGVAGSTSPANVNNTNNVLKFAAVAGTPASSPNQPTVPQIQSAIGAANPYIVLAEVLVGASVTSVGNGNITDKRVIASSQLAAKSVTADKVDWATSGKIWWEEIARFTLTTAASSFTLSSIPPRKYLRVFVNIVNTTATDSAIQFNGDTGNNYNYSIDDGGGAAGGANKNFFVVSTASGGNVFAKYDIVNSPSRPKIGTGMIASLDSNSAAASIYQRNVYGAWHNASQINSIRVYGSYGGPANFGVGSEIIVLGHD